MTIGSTTLGTSATRGKLCGLIITAESFGRFLGPVGFATIYAWSVSPSASASTHGLVNHNFAFYLLAAILALCALVSWTTLTAEKFVMQDDAAVGVVQKEPAASKKARTVSEV